MKKIVSVLLALVVLLMFTSCLTGGEDVGPTEGRGVPSLSFGGSSSSDDEIHGEAESTGLTDADMKALCKNYDKIMDALDEYGANYEVDDYDTYDADIDAIFEEYGVSGPNQYNKFIMVYYCYMVLDYDAEMKKDFKTALTMKAMGLDPIAEYRRMINDDDYAIVKANYKAYKKAVENY
ncbi:MAG: hypothetical protein KBT02_11480 [Treponema sp.]|nr:hypothetical protein [Candidatus Treponema caballi]